jgi:hypothetical protein
MGVYKMREVDFASNQLNKILKEFAKELLERNDRSATIVAVAWMDEILSEILKRFLLSDKDTKETLIDSLSFKVKIELIFRLGFIDHDFARALHCIREIRNHFSHKVFAELNKNPQKSQVKKLFTTFSSDYLNCLNDLFFKDFERSKGCYRAILLSIIVMLNVIKYNTKRLTTFDSPVKLIYQNKKE